MDKPGPGHLYWMILELTPNIPKGVALISRWYQCHQGLDLVRQQGYLRNGDGWGSDSVTYGLTVVMGSALK